MITEVSEIRDHVGRVDSMNMLVVTSAMAYDAETNHVPLYDAEAIQLEGFVLHPRRLECEPFEVTADTQGDVEFLLRVIRESAGALALRQADGLSLANEGVNHSLGELEQQEQEILAKQKVLNAEPLIGLHKNLGGKS